MEELVECAIMKDFKVVTDPAEAESVARMLVPNGQPSEAIQPSLGMWMLEFPPDLFNKLTIDGFVEHTIGSYTIAAEMP
jgi:hypothetical protein